MMYRPYNNVSNNVLHCEFVIENLSERLCERLSVTRLYYAETTEYMVKMFTLCGSHVISFCLYVRPSITFWCYVETA